MEHPQRNKHWVLYLGRELTEEGEGRRRMGLEERKYIRVTYEMRAGERNGNRSCSEKGKVG